MSDTLTDTERERVERVARAILRARGAAVVADTDWWETATDYYAACAKHPGYEDARSLVNDAFRDARAARAAADQWLPIESAGDLEHALLWVPSSIPSALTGVRYGNLWFETGGRPVEPTHFRPLPQPPEAK